VSGAAPPRISAAIVTYDSAGHLAGTLGALLPQLEPGDELVVVDNASSDATASEVRRLAPAARLIALQENVGFAAGANAAARAASAELLLLLNPDARPAPGCLAALRRAALDRPGWGAWQALVTLPGGELVNTSGGVVHFLGMGWAGRCGEPVAAAPGGYAEVGFASGAALAVRRPAWLDAGGFDERYFMYGEDLDLALRLRLAGWGVGIAPAARVDHEYEFEKGGRKWYLLERNRWWTVLSDYPAPLLALLAPALLLAELGLVAVAARDGRLRSKLRALAAVVRELPQILERRRRVQSGARAGAAELARSLSADLDSPYLGLAGRLAPLVAAQRAYWRAVLWALGARSSRS
jgi:GT2 family glycosyltransferase